jgi:hypothetical protein
LPLALLCIVKREDRNSQGDKVEVSEGGAPGHWAERVGDLEMPVIGLPPYSPALHLAVNRCLYRYHQHCW